MINSSDSSIKISTCAIGIALMLGFTLPDNFRYPYAAIGFSDFWRRWHITLSTWLRDYLYIPLGGNRKGTARTYLNLMITMLLGGLWHGASWTFVVWGALHGLYLSIERLIRDRLLTNKPTPSRSVHAGMVITKATLIPTVTIGSEMIKVGLALLTFLVVTGPWVFFRATDFDTAMRLLLAMFGVIPVKIPTLTTLAMLKVGLVTVALLGCHWFMRDTSLAKVANRMPWWVLGLGWGVMLILLVLTQK